MKKYLKKIFQQYNYDSDSGKYYIDQEKNIYFARDGQIEKIAEERNIDYLKIGEFENNLYIYGKLNNKPAGKYIFTSEGPDLIEKYINENTAKK